VRRAKPLAGTGAAGQRHVMNIRLFIERRWISPYVFSCFVTLTEKALGFDVRVLDAEHGDTRTGEYLSRTITGRVPSLEHGDFALAESSAIVEYLEQAFPEAPVLPLGLRERARCRQLMSWLRSDDTAALREARPTTTMFYARAEQPLTGAARVAADKLVAVSERLLAHGGPHLFGQWCIADSELAFMLQRLLSNGDAVPERVRVYAEAQWQRPSVRKFVERERPPL